MSTSEDPVGKVWQSEWRASEESETGRRLRRLTSFPANSYPLYYFVPSHTTDGRWLVFHSERSGWVQLYRMDMETGEMTQLTEGRTRDSGWAFFCEYHTRGIFNHLSALNPISKEVFYFDSDTLRGVHLESLADRVIWRGEGRIPIGQSAFSESGERFAFIHADERTFREATADRLCLSRMGGRLDPEIWRERIPATVTVLETQTGKTISEIEIGFHVHHVLFVGEDRLLINHPRDGSGMWLMNLDGSGDRVLRPRDEKGAPCHQIVTKRGIFYEAYKGMGAENQVSFGQYDLERDVWRERLLPKVQYSHIGADPEGKFLFMDNRRLHPEPRHEILHIERCWDAGGPRPVCLHTLAPLPAGAGQRHHCHPFLSPDRREIFFTEVVQGFSQVSALDVSDLVAASDSDAGWEGEGES